MSARLGESRSATIAFTPVSASSFFARGSSRTIAATSYFLSWRISWRTCPPMKPVAPKQFQFNAIFSLPVTRTLTVIVWSELWWGAVRGVYKFLERGK
jgi:hypothetical protein